MVRKRTVILAGFFVASGVPKQQNQPLEDEDDLEDFERLEYCVIILDS